jgi:hypothetical protein
MALPPIETTIAAPVEQVWRALREPAEVKRWFGWEYDGLDDEIDQIFVAGADASEDDWAIAFGNGDRIELTPLGDQTVVGVSRGEPEDESGWDAIHEGWLTFMQQLRLGLERHPGEDRRTLFFAGEPGGASPVEELGLGEDVWYRSPYQLGLLVEGYGDGLVVIAEQPGGPAQLIVTTYGLDDAAFGAVRDRWQRWWESASAEAGTPPADG